MSDQKSGFVILHYGPMGPEAMMKASKLAGKNAVIGTDAARMAGASFAFGSADLLGDLQERLAPGVIEEMRRLYPGHSRQAVTWLATGERGLSSEAVFTHLTGTRIHDEPLTNHPHDPADLRRCRLLIETVPECAGKIDKMADLSPQWARLVAAWEEICATMDAEAPDWREAGGPASRTYEMMKQVLKEG